MIGLEFVMGCYAILDRVPKGRDERPFAPDLKLGWWTPIFAACVKSLAGTL
jgi:predicted dithiol-disulfide oxidoreductase (DUF899 family)